MKALLLHANKWRSYAKSVSSRIGDCEPEEWDNPTWNSEYETNCLVTFFQVEDGDTESEVRRLCRNLKKRAKQLGTRRVVVAPFAHLSTSRPDPEVAKRLCLLVVETCRLWNVNGTSNEWEITSSHFGWNKTLLLDVKGHPNAFVHWSS